QLLELLLGGFVTGVHVGMELLREGAIGLLDVVLGGVLSPPQHVVIVPFGHRPRLLSRLARDHHAAGLPSPSALNSASTTPGPSPGFSGPAPSPPSAGLPAFAYIASPNFMEALPSAYVDCLMPCAAR